MKNGLVLEVQKKYAVVMTPSGEFVKVKKYTNDIRIGRTLSFSQRDEYKELAQMVNYSKFKRFASAAVAAAVFLMTFHGNFASSLDSVFDDVAQIFQGDSTPSTQFALIDSNEDKNEDKTKTIRELFENEQDESIFGGNTVEAETTDSETVAYVDDLLPNNSIDKVSVSPDLITTVDEPVRVIDKEKVTESPIRDDSDDTSKPVEEEKDNSPINEEPSTSPIKEEPTTPTPPSNGGIDDEYVAGVDYGEEDEEDSEQEEDNEQEEPTYDGPIEGTNPENTCTQDGFYYETERILTFEQDENGNVIEVWKDVQIKKSCEPFTEPEPTPEPTTPEVDSDAGLEYPEPTPSDEGLEYPEPTPSDEGLEYSEPTEPIVSPELTDANEGMVFEG